MRYVVRLPVSKRHPMVLEYTGSEWTVEMGAKDVQAWFEENPDVQFTLRAPASRGSDGGFRLESDWTYEFDDEAKANEFREKFFSLD